MKIGQLNMRRSPLVGELTLQFLQNSKIAVLLVQDPPKTWQTRSTIGRFTIFKSAGDCSLTLILVDQKLQASLVPVGASRVCVVELVFHLHKVFFSQGMCSL